MKQIELYLVSQYHVFSSDVKCTVQSAPFELIRFVLETMQKHKHDIEFFNGEEEFFAYATETGTVDWLAEIQVYGQEPEWDQLAIAVGCMDINLLDGEKLEYEILAPSYRSIQNVYDGYEPHI